MRKISIGPFCLVVVILMQSTMVYAVNLFHCNGNTNCTVGQLTNGCQLRFHYPDCTNNSVEVFTNESCINSGGCVHRNCACDCDASGGSYSWCDCNSETFVRGFTCDVCSP
jgi:hypothetical protein